MSSLVCGPSSTRRRRPSTPWPPRRGLLEAAGFTAARRDRGVGHVARPALRGAGRLPGGVGARRRPSSSTAGSGSIGAHTDSPNLRIKPRPDTGRAGYRQLAVEVYGGVLLNSWLDRDLGLSGRVAVRGGAAGSTVHLVRVDRPLLRVPQLAIHLDREVNETGPDAQPPAAPRARSGASGPVDEGGLRARASPTSSTSRRSTSWPGTSCSTTSRRPPCSDAATSC